MSATRRYWSRQELRAVAPPVVWWPAASIVFLCVFTLIAPAGLVTGMNLYLLLLAFVGWLATRRPFEPALIRMGLPFGAIIVIGLVGGIGADRYLYLKDAWYCSNPAVVMAVGFVFGRLLGDVKRGLRAFVIGGSLIALLHLSVFVVNPDLLDRQATQIRSFAGNGFHATALASVLPIAWIGRWRTGLGLAPGVAGICLALCTGSLVLSFSRTMVLVVALGLLAMVGYFARRELLRVLGLAVLVAAAITALQTNVDTTSLDAKRSFVGKLARSIDELSVSEDHYSRAAINVNWRGYETARALDTWSQGHPLQLAFGRGFGAQVDLGLFQNLSRDPLGAVRFIPVFHNGYVYLLVKTGIVGVLLYLGVLVWLYRVGRRHAGGARGGDKTMHGRALQACVVVLGVTTWVVSGAFNKFDMIALLLLLGLLLAAHEPAPS
jgi:hypothetical protein